MASDAMDRPKLDYWPWDAELVVGDTLRDTERMEGSVVS